MKKRSPIGVFCFSFLTFGIYLIYWYISVAAEMKAKGAEIPHWILIFIPIASWYYMWKFSVGVAKVTNNGFTAGTSFLLMFLLSALGMAIVQSKLNEVV